jgi:hypothetical protein
MGLTLWIGFRTSILREAELRVDWQSASVAITSESAALLTSEPAWGIYVFEINKDCSIRY